MTAFALSWFELAIRAELPDRGSLVPFLSAYFEPVIRVAPWPAPDGAPPIASLAVTVGPPPPDAPSPEQGIPQPVDRSGGFLRCDGRVVELPGARWIWLAPSGVAVRVAGAAISVWGPDEDALRVPVLRIVEDVLLDEAQRRGAVVVHASAVVAQDRAIVFCGNKGAGKTTALLRALEQPGTALLANDNVCLVPHAGGYQVRGWPAFLKVEVGTVASTRPLAGDLPAACVPWLADPVALWDIYEKVALYPQQAATRFGAPLAAAAALGSLVFPRFRPDHPPSLGPMPAGEAAELLPQFLQGVFNPNHAPWLRGSVDRDLVRAGLERFVRWIEQGAVPLYALSWAPSIEDLVSLVPEVAAARHEHATRRAPAAADPWPPLPASPSGATITFKSRRNR